MFDFDKAYDPVTDSYLIPKEFITKGIRKNIEQVVEKVELINWRRKIKTATTHAGVADYIKKMWGQNKDRRVPLDEVTTYMLADVSTCFATGNNRTFVENGVNVVRRVTLQESELPTNLEIGLSYRADFNKNNFVNLSTTFMNSSYASDEYKFGLEYNYNNYLFLRGSLKVLPDKEEDEAMFGPSFGIGLRYPVGGVNLGFDYAYRIVDQSAFNSTNQFFTFNLGF